MNVIAYMRYNDKKQKKMGSKIHSDEQTFLDIH